MDFERAAMTGDNAKDVQFAVTFQLLLTASDDFTKQSKTKNIVGLWGHDGSFFYFLGMLQKQVFQANYYRG